MNWKMFSNLNAGLWGTVAGIVALLAYFGIFPSFNSVEFTEIDHVVIKSTVGANDQIGISLKNILASKGLKITGPELPSSEQERELDKVLKVFHRNEWNEAKKLMEIVKDEAGYKLDIVPVFDDGSIVAKGQVQIWLAQ